MPLMISVSGVRGIVGESLTPEVITRFATAFGTYMRGGKIVVARDSRVSGAMIKHSVFAGLMSAGCKIVDCDICPTPSASLLIEESDADGGIVISGSHNPVEWNALKFFRSDGMYLNAAEGRLLLDIYYQGDFRKVEWDALVPKEENETAGARHVEKVLAQVDVPRIRRAKLKVVLDACNGAGSVITPDLLSRLGCEVVRVHCEPNGLFPHNPEPIFVHLADLRRTVRATDADVGFAQDADADRLAIVDDCGRFIGEEYTLTVAVDHILTSNPGVVVTNLSTTRAVDDVAARHGSRVMRTPVGEVNVAEAMRREGAVIGGEGNGGVIDPRVQLRRDSLAAIAITLDLLATRSCRVSKEVKSLPRYHMTKEKVACGRGAAPGILELIEQEVDGASINRDDGLRLDWEKSWMHVRPSGTEPAVRIIAEARTRKESEAICHRYMEIVRKAVS